MESGNNNNVFVIYFEAIRGFTRFKEFDFNYINCKLHFSSFENSGKRKLVTGSYSLVKKDYKSLLERYK